jgi:hypothetical protein
MFVSSQPKVGENERTFNDKRKQRSMAPPLSDSRPLCIFLREKESRSLLILCSVALMMFDQTLESRLEVYIHTSCGIASWRSRFCLVQFIKFDCHQGFSFSTEKYRTSEASFTSRQIHLCRPSVEKIIGWRGLDEIHKGGLYPAYVFRRVYQLSRNEIERTVLGFLEWALVAFFSTLLRWWRVHYNSRLWLIYDLFIPKFINLFAICSANTILVS